MTVNRKLTNLKTIGMLVGATLSIATTCITMFSYLNEMYVSRAELTQERNDRSQEMQEIKTQISDLQRSLNVSNMKISTEIRKSKIYSLIVRRDVLQSRSKLTLDEQAELRLLETKIRENAQASKDGLYLDDASLTEGNKKGK